ncbi:MAG: hypothetical protein ASARMPRED_003614 [Alectoria sarmentosa]|nr:MAG: hypothetical protein ASARMPRED_003614 [Alectoria sarmentosa]
MPDTTLPRQYSTAPSKSHPVLSPNSQKILQDALIDSNPPTPRYPLTIAFSAEADLSPKLKHELQKALAHDNAWPDPYPKDRIAKDAWVDRNAKALYAAFAKASKAESSTCGYEKLGDRCAAKEGTARDLRFTLVSLVVLGFGAVEADELARWGYSRRQFHLEVVMCVEEADEEEAKGRAPASDSTVLIDKDDENWVSIKREQKRWFKELKP